MALDEASKRAEGNQGPCFHRVGLGPLSCLLEVCVQLAMERAGRAVLEGQRVPGLLSRLRSRPSSQPRGMRGSGRLDPMQLRGPLWSCRSPVLGKEPRPEAWPGGGGYQKEAVWEWGAEVPGDPARKGQPLTPGTPAPGTDTYISLGTSVQVERRRRH